MKSLVILLFLPYLFILRVYAGTYPMIQLGIVEDSNEIKVHFNDLGVEYERKYKMRFPENELYFIHERSKDQWISSKSNWTEQPYIENIDKIKLVQTQNKKITIEIVDVEKNYSTNKLDLEVQKKVENNYLEILNQGLISNIEESSISQIPSLSDINYPKHTSVSEQKPNAIYLIVGGLVLLIFMITSIIIIKMVKFSHDSTEKMGASNIYDD